jgi:selenium metabolism protein YedF
VKPKVFIVQSEELGGGDRRLGSMLMASFLRLLGESREKPATMIFLNSAVRLVCDGSNVLDHVRKLEKQGVEMLACTTCLEYFDFTDNLKVGKPTTMAKSVQSMMTADVISL